MCSTCKTSVTYNNTTKFVIKNEFATPYLYLFSGLTRFLFFLNFKLIGGKQDKQQVGK